MTNAQIIFNASVQLMNDGIIKGTGRVFEFTDDAGNVSRLEEPEALHTYAAWQEIGRQVKRGEKAKATITIWKQGKSYTTTNKETGEQEEKEGRMFMKNAYFFTFDQTEPKTEKKGARKQ